MVRTQIQQISYQTQWPSLFFFWHIRGSQRVRQKISQVFQVAECKQMSYNSINLVYDNIFNAPSVSAKLANTLAEFSRRYFSLSGDFNLLNNLLIMVSAEGPEGAVTIKGY